MSEGAAFTHIFLTVDSGPDVAGRGVTGQTGTTTFSCSWLPRSAAGKGAAELDGLSS